MVLHHETGTLDRLPFYDALANHYDVLVPHHPGFSRSQRPEWMRNTRDIAVIYRGLLGTLGLRDAALIGLGFGGLLVVRVGQRFVAVHVRAEIRMVRVAACLSRVPIHLFVVASEAVAGFLE